VRFDFNTAGEWSDDETWPEHDGFSLGVPTLEGDPDAYGVQYGLRQLEFNVIISGAYSDASRLWSQLAKELVTRRTNWLLFQFSAFSQPVWFKTYRTAPDALDFEQVDDTDDASSNLWGLGVQLAAEPFAYGERVTLPTLTVTNDPAAATNPCMAVLPEILGDAPAPARFEMTRRRGPHHPVADVLRDPGPDDVHRPDRVPVRDRGRGHRGHGHGRAGGFGATTRAARTARSRSPRTDMVRGAPVPCQASARSVRGDAAVGATRHHVDQYALPGEHRRPLVRPGRRPGPPAVSAGNYAQWVDLGTFAFPNGLHRLRRDGCSSRQPSAIHASAAVRHG
jgi:hypothetical protein